MKIITILRLIHFYFMLSFHSSLQEHFQKYIFLFFIYLFIFQKSEKEKQAVKSTRIKKSYIGHTGCFHLTHITDKNSRFTFKKLLFSTFTTFSLHS